MFFRTPIYSKKGKHINQLIIWHLHNELHNPKTNLTFIIWYKFIHISSAYIPTLVFNKKNLNNIIKQFIIELNKKKTDCSRRFLYWTHVATTFTIFSKTVANFKVLKIWEQFIKHLLTIVDWYTIERFFF